MSIPAFSVKRPVASLMIIIALIVLGGVSISRLPLALFPDFNFPAAVVMTTYENVGPREVEAQVTRPIEEVDGHGEQRAPGQFHLRTRRVHRHRRSSSWGTDMDFAALEMRERLDLILSFLPDGVEQPQVFRFDPSMQPDVSVQRRRHGGSGSAAAVRRGQHQKPPGAGRRRGPGQHRRRLGAGNPRRGGPVRDWKHYGLSVDHVMQALAAGNLTLPGGRIVEQGRELTIRTVGEFTDLDEIRRDGHRRRPRRRRAGPGRGARV